MLIWQLRNELWKLFGKKRTYIGFGMILLTQLTIALVFRYTHASRQMIQTLEGNGYLAEPFISALTISTIMLFPLAYVLLPLYISLVGGDLVAKEAEDGTLRMILSRPISRFRLLLVKWLAGIVFCGLLVAMLGTFGLLIGRFCFHWGGLFVFMPGEVFGIFDAGSGFSRYLIAHLMLILKSVSVLSVAFMFSCFNIKPAAATILALSFIFVNRILQEIPYFRDLQPWFLTYHFNLWQWMFAQPIPWWRVGESFSMLLGFNFTFLALGCAVFQVRDIKS
jgi:ABC-2 type transport system permease protein